MANKIYKTILFLLMIVALYIPYFDFYHEFFSVRVGERKTPTDEKICSLVEDFYRKKDIYGSKLKNPYFSENTERYLNEKIKAHKFVKQTQQIIIENYNVNAEIINKEENANSVLYIIQAISTYNYFNVDVDTTVSEEVRLIYNKNQKRIIDFYTPNNYFDEAVRGKKQDKSFKEALRIAR